MPRLAFILFLTLNTAVLFGADAPPKPRLIVTTDIGGDPDDRQSMIRLMVHSNEFEIEALIASAAGTPGELKTSITKPELIREIVEAYGQVRANLLLHAPGFPTSEDLLKRIHTGNPNRGTKFIGAEHDTEGSKRIIEIVDGTDPRPVNIAIWGGQTDLAQTLWRVKNDRGPEGLKAFMAKIRAFDIDDQDGIASWINQQFPGLWYILAKAPGKDKREGAYRGVYLGGDEALTSREWLDQHVRTEHGPLGALYPNATWTAPNRHNGLKEGDTPSWLYFLPRGFNDPAHPEWGSFGGRYTLDAATNVFRDAKDSGDGEPRARTTVSRWRPTFQAEFQARMDWCVKKPERANHPPVAVMNGDATTGILTIPAAAGATVSFNAKGSSDPDGDTLAFRWWVYKEAGTYTGSAAATDAVKEDTALTIPADAAGTTIHVLLEVRDNGAPPLTAFRRAVVEVAK